MTYPTRSCLTHLRDNTISEIALRLTGDVYGASGDLTDKQVFERLVKAVAAYVRSLSHVEAVPGTIPVREAARLIFDVWAYMDRRLVEQTILSAKPDEPLPENPLEKPFPY
jgi:hypothetical protein